MTGRSLTEMEDAALTRLAACKDAITARIVPLVSRTRRTRTAAAVLLVLLMAGPVTHRAVVAAHHAVSDHRAAAAIQAGQPTTFTVDTFRTDGTTLLLQGSTGQTTTPVQVEVRRLGRDIDVQLDAVVARDGTVHITEWGTPRPELRAVMATGLFLAAGGTFAFAWAVAAQRKRRTFIVAALVTAAGTLTWALATTVHSGHHHVTTVPEDWLGDLAPLGALTATVVAFLAGARVGPSLRNELSSGNPAADPTTTGRETDGGTDGGATDRTESPTTGSDQASEPADEPGVTPNPEQGSGH